MATLIMEEQNRNKKKMFFWVLGFWGFWLVVIHFCIWVLFYIDIGSLGWSYRITGPSHTTSREQLPS
jgi:hypothetical protein